MGINGLVEKDVNLSIALSLAEDLKANHFTVILVRDGDYSVGDQSLPTVAERKRSDTKTGWLWWNRWGIAFWSASIKTNSPKANTVALKCSIPPITLKAPNWQKQSGKVLSPLYSGKHPQNKEAGEEIYLLTHCQVPAVLVECGFLSNPGEAELLGQEEYQQQMAASIYNGIIAFLDQRQEENSSQIE